MNPTLSVFPDIINGLQSGVGLLVAVAAAGFGVSLILFSLSRSFWLSTALLMPVGFSMMVQMASSNPLIQSMVPNNLRTMHYALGHNPPKNLADVLAARSLIYIKMIEKEELLLFVYHFVFLP